MKYDFIGLGDITTDNFIELKDVDILNKNKTKELCFRFGEKIAYEDSIEVPAVGNSANAAVSASRLGLDSALVAGIGDDFNGQVCTSHLQKEQVGTDFLRVHKDLPTNYHIVLRFGAERTILVKQHPYNYQIPKFEEDPDWFYFSSIGEHALDFHSEVAKFVSGRKTKLAFQPGTFQIKLGYERLKELYEVVDIFFCNKEEAQYILENDSNDMKELLRQMHLRGPKIAVITDGPNGAFAYDGRRFYSLPMYPDIAPPVDRTGAGDSFSSTTVAYLAKGYPVEEAMLRGPVNSMSVVQYIGAQKGLLNEQALEAYLKSAPDDYKVSIERDI